MTNIPLILSILEHSQSSPLVHPFFTFGALFFFAASVKVRLVETRNTSRIHPHSGWIGWGGHMGKVIVMPTTSHTTFSNRDTSRKRNHVGMTTTDFRRVLCNLQLQPPSQRAFLRKLLKRALAAHGVDRFPVTILADPNP